MKRLISILVITAMLLASVMAMIPAFADEIETPKAPTEGTYNVDWKALVDAGKMAASDNNVVINNFASLYTPVADANSLTLTKVAGSDAKGVTYYSTDMFALSATTYFEYVLTAKNTSGTAYGGIVFAYDTQGYPYIIIGSTDNKSDDGETSEFRMEKGENDVYVLGGTTRGFLKLDVDKDSFGTIKVVYDGYKVSVYGLTDAANGTYELVPNTTFTLPEGSKIALGTFARAHRTNIIKNAVLTAGNRESAAILAGASEAKVALAAALDAAYNVIPTDYTDETATALINAVNAAELAFAAETEVEADVTAATTAINAAITALVIKKADLNALIEIYAVLKYNSSTYSPIEVDKAMTEIEAALNNKAILQSEVDAIAAKYSEIAKIEVITTAEEFANMKADGAYILKADIEIDSAYGEFKGYFNANRHTITVKNCGVFTTLNGAIVSDLTIAGSITASTHIGALATDAIGNVAINNVVNNASITVNSSGKNVAGFIAQGKGTNITFNNCVNAADIIGGRTAGFYANTNSGTNNLYFYSCINLGNISCGEGVATNPAAGFVARTTDGTTKDIVFDRCVELGDINAMYSSGAFFGCGQGNIVMTNCVVGGATPVEVTAADTNSHLRPMGGVIGGANSDADSKDGAFSVVIDGCIFNVNLTVTKNYSTNPMAIVVGGAGQGTVSIKNTSVNGVLDATKASLNAYKLSSTAPTVENVFINVELKVPALRDESKEPISGKGTEDDPFVYPYKEPADLTPNTDAKDFDDYTIIDARIELARALNIVDALELADVKAEAKAFVLGMLKSADEYTVESYAEYMADINKLIADVYAAADIDAIEALEGDKIIAAAEAKLVTLEAKAEADAKAEAEAKAKELTDAKAVALIALSAKRENAGKVFTADSYKAYSDAFDAIKAQIEGAADIAALNAIDVAALKVAAENKLVVDVPDAPDAPGADDNDDDNKDDDNKDDGNKDDETDKATDENKDDDTVPNTKKGCSSSVAISALAVVGVIGAAVVLKKKED